MPFGVLAEVPPEVVAKADAIRGVFGFLGKLAGALARSGRKDDEDEEAPCPDGRARHGRTPCEERQEDLLAKARAAREARMRARAGG